MHDLGEVYRQCISWVQRSKFILHHSMYPLADSRDPLCAIAFTLGAASLVWRPGSASRGIGALLLTFFGNWLPTTEQIYKKARTFGCGSKMHIQYITPHSSLKILKQLKGLESLSLSRFASTRERRSDGIHWVCPITCSSQ